MFKLEPNPTFWSPARLTVPGDATPAEVEVEWKHKPREALKAWIESSTDRADDETLGEVINAWRGVSHDYTPAALRSLLANYPAAARELFDAYLSALTESRAKN